MSQTEDVPYDIDPFAIEDQVIDDPEGETQQVIDDAVFKDIKVYLAEAIQEHNSFDIIDLTEQAKMTPTQQIAVHKCVVQHLRSIRNMINDKRKEN